MLGDNFRQTLEAARTGAEWAWASLYRDLAPSVLGYLRARGAPEPEDLTAEVFLQVVRDLGGFEGGEREFRAWVFVIAHHRLLDDSRWRGRRPTESPAEVPDEGGPDDATQEAAHATFAADRVQQILGRLSADRRDVILLRVLGDLTVDEVARVVGKSRGAVKALQRRALAAVKKELAKEGVTL